MSDGGGEEKLATTWTEATRWRVIFVTACALTLLAVGLNLAFSQLRSDGAWSIGYGSGATALMVGAALLGVRRRAMGSATRLGLGSARAWLYFHLYGGTLFLILVLLHSSLRIPSGWVTLWLWGLSWWTAASGAVGLALQQWLPRALSSGLGTEVLYPRIPELVEDLKRQAEELVKTCEQPIPAFYDDQLAAVLERPRRRAIYLIDISGGVRSRLRVFDYLEPFVSEADEPRLDRLREIFRTKLEIDAHYTLQPVLRAWLYLHGPTSMLLFGFLVVHLVSVLYY